MASGASLTTKDAFDFSAVELAISRDMEDTLQLFIEAGFNFCAPPERPPNRNFLHFAARRGASRCLMALMDLGLDPLCVVGPNPSYNTRPNGRGDGPGLQTLLHLACENGLYQPAHALIERGCPAAAVDQVQQPHVVSPGDATGRVNGVPRPVHLACNALRSRSRAVCCRALLLLSPWAVAVGLPCRTHCRA